MNLRIPQPRPAPLVAPAPRRETAAPSPAAGRTAFTTIPSAGDVLRLQRTLGNRAVGKLLSGLRPPAVQRSAREVRPRAQAPRNTLQRAVILLDVNPDDYALQKVLTGLDPTHLRLVDSAGAARNLDTGAGERAMIPHDDLGDVEGVAEDLKEERDDDQVLLRNNEDVYIVGHGAVGGRVWTAPNHGGETGDFSSIVSAIKAMAGGGWAGSIRVMTCNSEVQGAQGQSSVVEKLTEEWGDNAPGISGQSGFAYGMGTHQPGQMAVLKNEYAELYKGDNYDADTAQHLLDRANASATARNLINFDPTDRRLYPRAQDRLHGAWDAFVAKMKTIERALNAIVLDRNNTHGVRGTDTLTKAGTLSTNAAFQQLIADQHALFDAFELWE